MDELTVGLGRFKAANCCFLGSISNMSTHLLLFRNLSRLFPELTTECSYKSVGIGVLLLFLLCSLLSSYWQSSVGAAMVRASRQLYDCNLIMRMKNGLQVFFSFSFGKKLSQYQTKILKVSPTRKYSLGRISRLNKHMCWSRTYSKVLRSFFWKWFLSLQVTLGWAILTWVMWKFTATFYNCKFCSTELKLDYSDNRILWLKDLWSMIGMEENLLTTCCWQEDTWPIPLPWQICQIWIIHLF